MPSPFPKYTTSKHQTHLPNIAQPDIKLINQTNSDQISSHFPDILHPNINPTYEIYCN